MWCRVQGGHSRRGEDGTEREPEEGKNELGRPRKLRKGRRQCLGWSCSRTDRAGERGPGGWGSGISLGEVSKGWWEKFPEQQVD